MYGRPCQDTDATQAASADDSLSREAATSAFSLSSLLLFTTLICIYLGCHSVHPILGLIVAMFIIPALLRTIWQTQLQLPRDNSESCAVKVELFLRSGAEVLASAAFAAAVAIAGLFGMLGLALFVGLVCNYLQGSIGGPSTAEGVVFYGAGTIILPMLTGAIFFRSLRSFWTRKKHGRAISAACRGDEVQATLGAIQQAELENANT